MISSPVAKYYREREEVENTVCAWCACVCACVSVHVCVCVCVCTYMYVYVCACVKTFINEAFSAWSAGVDKEHTPDGILMDEVGQLVGLLLRIKVTPACPVLLCLSSFLEACRYM